jgi:hypothetical protein
VKFFQQPNESCDSLSAATAKKPLLTIPDYPFKIGEKLQATIVDLVTPNDFYIQPVVIDSKIDKMTAAVTAEFEANIPPMWEMLEGDFCWARFPADLAWHRAHVS